MTNKKIIYGANGEPLDVEASMNGTAYEKRRANVAILKSYSNYAQSVFGVRDDPARRAQDPFSNHAWVYAAAMVRAINISQAQFLIYGETKDQLKNRTEKMIAKGFPAEPPRNRGGRRAIQRHLTRSANPDRFWGTKLRASEPMLGHPLMDVLSRANSSMTGAQLWQATELFMALRGECFWILAGKDQQRLGSRGEVPTEIFPITPDSIEPIIEDNRLVSWRYKQTTRTMQIPTPQVGDKTGDIYLLPWEVVHFKYVNPTDSLRGYSPLIPVASSISMDMSSKAHNLSVINNGANPGGLLVAKVGQEPWTSEEETEFLQKWHQRHGGVHNRGELSILTAPMDYIPTGMSPQDLQYLDSMRYSREEVFATMRVPKTVVGITDTVNYATQLGQDANLWDKCLLPEVRYFEDVIDATLLWEEPDTIFAAFDLSGIEALRTSLADKIQAVNSLTGAGIHMPPNEAFKLVGLDVPEYLGSDKSILGGTTTDALIKQAEAPPPPPMLPDGSVAPILPVVPEAVVPSDKKKKPKTVTEAIQEISGAKSLISKADSNKKYWDQINKRCYTKMEPRLIRAWRGFVRDVRNQFTDRFDDGAKNVVKAMKAVSINGYDNNDIALAVASIMPSSAEISQMIQDQFRDPLMANLMDVFQYTVDSDFGGMSVIEIDSPALMGWFNMVDDRLAATAAFTLQTNMSNAVRAGMENGEDLNAIKERMSQIFRISESDSKCLTVARTESGSFVNNARNIMFQQQGFTTFEWSTAQDEFVRQSHAEYGMLPAQPMGYQYSVGLSYPHDPNCMDASELINCRCVLLPVE